MQLTITDTALFVVSHPEAYHTQPAVLAIAWQLLMEERGCRVDLARLGEPAHLVEAQRFNPVAAAFEDSWPRCRERIAAHLSATRAPAPTGGDAA